MRWAVGKKMLMPILESCPQKYLCDFVQAHNSEFIRTLEGRAELAGMEPAELCFSAFFQYSLHS